MALAAALAVLGGVALYVTTRDEGPKEAPRFSQESRDGSELVARSATAVELDPARAPQTYDITWRITDYGGTEVTKRTERLRVRRPFDSRLEAWPDDEPTGRPAVQVSTFARIDVLASGSTPASNILVPPYTAGSDVRLDAALPDLLRERRALPRETREVARQRCRVLRTDKAIRGGDLGDAPGEDARDFVDTCVSDAGLVLEEVTVTGGRVRSHRVATRVATGMRLGDDLFPHDAPPTSTQAQGRGSVRAVDPTTRSLGTFWELDAPPQGFTRQGRYAVVPPQAPPTADQDPDEVRERRPASATDVWVRGPDLLLIDQGGTLGRIQVLDIPANAAKVDLGPLGQGGVLLDTRMNEVRVLQAEGRFVRVLGTLPAGQLVEVARALRRTEGTGFTYL